MSAARRRHGPRRHEPLASCELVPWERGRPARLNIRGPAIQCGRDARAPGTPATRICATLESEPRNIRHESGLRRTFLAARRFAEDPGRVEALARDIRIGRTTSETLVGRCLERIAEVEEHVQAWRVVDADRALEDARTLDREVTEGRLRGPLHGLPVAVKDVMDVAGLPTRCNSRAPQDRAPPPPVKAAGANGATEHATIGPKPAIDRAPRNVPGHGLRPRRFRLRRRCGAASPRCTRCTRRRRRRRRSAATCRAGSPGAAPRRGRPRSPRGRWCGTGG